VPYPDQQGKAGLSILKRDGDMIFELEHCYYSLILPVTFKSVWKPKDDLRTIVFVGPNGSGKSALLHQLNMKTTRTRLISTRRKTDIKREKEEQNTRSLSSSGPSYNGEAAEAINIMYNIINSAEGTLDRHCNPAKPTEHDIPLFDKVVSDFMEREDLREDLNSLWTKIFPSLTLFVKNKEELRVRTSPEVDYNAYELSDGEKEGTFNFSQFKLDISGQCS